MRLSVNHALPLLLLIALNGCAIGGSARVAPAPPATSGPAADYPVILGEPFTIDGETFTPVDKLNFDTVGHAAVADIPGAAYVAAHKTLPLPSYVEVTSLVSGKTILLRVTERGPMRTDREIALSTTAAAQLGVGEGAPVRVRRVNPPESERAMLRSGGPAPERMDTPKPLLAVLMRKLDEKAAPGANRPVSDRAEPSRIRQLPDPDAAAVPVMSADADPQPAPMPAQRSRPAAPEVRTAAVSEGDLVVQVAAFSTRERANRAAAALGDAFVVRSGSYWRVRMGRFESRSQARAALAKARAAGYSDARIQLASE